MIDPKTEMPFSQEYSGVAGTPRVREKSDAGERQTAEIEDVIFQQDTYKEDKPQRIVIRARVIND
jgi:hypothetical protein